MPVHVGSPLAVGAGQTGETLAVVARAETKYERYWAEMRAEDRVLAEYMALRPIVQRFQKRDA